MTISSRTPEGMPHRCPVCGQTAVVDPSFPGGDSTCPRCGHLLWWFRHHIGAASGVAAEQIRLESSLLENLVSDSASLVELVMEVEEEFGVTIPDEETERMRTDEDVIRHVIRYRGETA